MSLESRVTELEVKLSYAEDMIDSLNKALFRQQKQLDLLQEQFTLLHRQMRENAEPVGETLNPRDEMPPHY